MKEKILVTGGAGFIGKSVVNRLLKDGYRVRVVDEFKNNVNSFPKSVETIIGNLENPEIADVAMENIDQCIHLASKIGGLDYLASHSAEILSINNKILSSVFEAAVRNKIGKIIYISSGMVFESTSKSVIREQDILKSLVPTSSYSFSKLIGEMYCRCFQDQFGLNFSIARLFNVYGEYNNMEINGKGVGHVIPELINKVLLGQKPLEIYGSGQQVRSFTYVTDAAEGILSILKNPNSTNDDFNISSDQKIRIIDLAKIIWELSKRKDNIQFKHLGRFNLDQNVRVPSVAKAKKLLGWTAKVKIKDGLKIVINNQKKYLNI